MAEFIYKTNVEQRKSVEKLSQPKIKTTDYDVYRTIENKSVSPRDRLTNIQKSPKRQNSQSQLDQIFQQNTLQHQSPKNYLKASPFFLEDAIKE